jgi:two-component sensor histidine kinase
LILNEAVSNSLKYAFPEEREGEIKIFLRSIDEDLIELIIGDDGVGISKEMDIRNTETLGLHFIVRLVEYQLGGEIELNRTNGTEYHIKFKRLLYKNKLRRYIT